MDNGRDKHTNVIMFNHKKFRVIDNTERKYVDKTTTEVARGFISVLLEELKTQIMFEVFTTHLKAKVGQEEIRADEMRQMLETVDQRDHPVIMTGDFNETPDGPALQLLLNNTKISNTTGATMNAFTTHKSRDGKMTTRTIDYQFYFAKKPGKRIGGTQKIIGVTGTYQLPAKSKLPKTGFPSVNHPSDHLALGYQYTFAK